MRFLRSLDFETGQNGKSQHPVSNMYIAQKMVKQNMLVENSQVFWYTFSSKM